MANFDLIKVVGVDPSQNSLVSGQRQLKQSPGVSLPDNAAQHLARQNDIITQSTANLLQGVEQRGQLEAQRHMAEASNTEPYKELKSILGNIAEGVQLYAKLDGAQREIEAKERAESIKAAKKEQAELLKFEITNRMGQLLLDLEATAGQEGHQKGIELTRKALQDLLVEYTPIMGAEAAGEVLKWSLSKLDDVQKTQASRAYSEAEATQKSYADMVAAQIGLKIANLVSVLKTSTDPTKVSQSVDQIFAVLGADVKAANLPPQYAMNVLAALQEKVADSFEIGESTRIAVNEKFEKAKKFYTAVQSIQLDPKMSPTSREMAITLKALELGVPELASNLPTYLENAKEALQYQEILAKARELRRQQDSVITDKDIREMQNYGMAKIAYGALHDPNYKYSLQALVDSGQATPFVKAALNMANEFSQDRTQFLKLNEEMVRQMLTISLYEDQQNPERGLAQYINDFIKTTPGLTEEAKKNLIQSVSNPLIRQTLGLPVGGRISLETVDAARQVLVQVREQAVGLLKKWEPSGLDLLDPRNGKRLEQKGAGVQVKIDLVNSSPEPTTGGSFILPNPNKGAAAGFPMTPPVVPLAQENGMTFPILKGQSIQITSRYGFRTHPVYGGTKFHSGIDIDVPNGVILTIQGGRVLSAQNWDGYGNTVLVQTPDGRVEQFSHLSKMTVKQGQVIPPGKQVGVQGATGAVTAPHLHFQVWQNADFSDPRRNTIDPERYMLSIRLNDRDARGLGLPPNQGQDGRMGKTAGGLSYQNEPVYASQHKRDYPVKNSRVANYGYAALRDDPAFARKVGEVADRLDIPAQWLVDLMALETGGTFSPSMFNGAGHPAVGLIQFYEDSAGSFRKTIGGRTYSLNEIAGMSRVRQMELVYEYLKPFKINTVVDLAVAVLAGGDRRAFEKGDSFITGAGYVNTLGSHVGRRYATKYTQVSASARIIHERYHSNCSICRKMGPSKNFRKHEAVYEE
jgi:murein DD-endopeptidase MepM/ murein hydrolase activator NlpD